MVRQLAAVMGVGALILAGLGCGEGQQASVADDEIADITRKAAGALRFGDRLPDFELPAMDGGTIRLHDAIDGESHVVVLWYAPTCPCARNCASAIAETITPQDYPDVRIVSVISEPILDYDWFQRDLHTEREEGRLPFAVAYDADQSVMRQWGTKRVPTVWATDKEGRIRFYGAPENTLEPLEPEYAFLLKEALDDLRAGREVRTPFFEPLGCLIAQAP